MNNAFYRIRQRLFKEKRYGQFISIALIEMLLIIVGIFLALQLENWNQEKQDSKVVLEYLEIIKTNIGTDLNKLEIVTDYRKQTLLFTDTIMVYYENEYISDPKLFELGFMSLFISRRFNPNTSAYESLKNSGFLRTLGNTKIEVGLNSYYSLIDQISKGEEEFNSIIIPIEEKLSENGFYIDYKEMFQGNYQDTIFFTYEEIKRFPDVQSTFIRAQIWLKYFVGAYSELLIEGNELLKILENGD